MQNIAEQTVANIKTINKKNKLIISLSILFLFSTNLSTCKAIPKHWVLGAAGCGLVTFASAVAFTYNLIQLQKTKASLKNNIKPSSKELAKTLKQKNINAKLAILFGFTTALSGAATAICLYKWKQEREIDGDGDGDDGGNGGNGPVDTDKCKLCNNLGGSDYNGGPGFCLSCGRNNGSEKPTITSGSDVKRKNDLMSQRTILDITKPCPNPTCNERIEKNAGCNHMTCKCGYHFCWRCSTEYKPNTTGSYSCSGCNKFFTNTTV